MPPPTRIGPASLVGLPCALAGARLLASVLYGVTPTTPHTFVLVSAVLLVVAFMAALIPARKAARVEPIVSLRRL